MAPASWKALFEPAGPGAHAVEVRVFVRGGHPLLVIPTGPRFPAGTAFALYAPQTLVARIANLAWRWSLPVGFAPGSRRDSVQIDPASPFVRYLASVSCANSATQASSQLPQIVILAGNPHAPAPRYLVQVFNPAREPIAVVKTGVGPAAAQLISREADFLEAAAGRTEHSLLAVPRVLGRFSHDHLCAFTMQFVRGASPRPAQAGGIAPVLLSWLDSGRKLRVGEFAAWQRLAKASGADPLFKRLDAALGPVEVHPALFHGDFVPWNIKVSPADGAWTVLDWERGEREGPPGWDWFHYVIQTAMLVEKKTGPPLLRAAREMLASSPFCSYISNTGLAGQEHEWLLAYLLYCRDVLRPKELAPGVESLLAELTRSS